MHRHAQHVFLASRIGYRLPRVPIYLRRSGLYSLRMAQPHRSQQRRVRIEMAASKLPQGLPAHAAFFHACPKAHIADSVSAEG